MDILQKISGQLASVGLPLFAVTLTAVPRADTPVLLILHWHGFRREPGASGVDLHEPVPASALQMNEHWLQLAELDGAMLEAAWRLGAWMLEREERRACSTLGVAEREALECRQAFGDNPLAPGRDDHLVAEAPDRPAMLRAGARVGYVRWSFRPVHGGVWPDCADDATLAADGSRTEPCPVGPQQPVGPRISLTRYRLGRARCLYLP